MIKQNWNIGLDEKKRILNLHESATKKMYLLFEQSQESEVFSVDFGTEFKSGDFNLNSASMNEIQQKLQNIVNFIKNKNITNYKIVISSGESQVPNQKPFNEIGSLARKRAEVLKEYLEKVLISAFGNAPKIEIKEPKIGSESWDETKDNKNDPKYTKEQFVKASIVVNSEPPYNRTAAMGESIFHENKYLIGFISTPSVKTTNIKNAGNLNTGYYNATFTEIKKDTQPTQVVAKYEIPWEWWNGGEYGNIEKRDSPTTNVITQKDLETIRRFPKV